MLVSTSSSAAEPPNHRSGAESQAGAAQPRLPPATMPTPPASATVHPVGLAFVGPDTRASWALPPDSRSLSTDGAKEFYDDVQREPGSGEADSQACEHGSIFFGSLSLVQKEAV